MPKLNWKILLCVKALIYLFIVQFVALEEQE